MNKYMILALLPIIFQGNMYCEDKINDINRMIQPQLISARTVMKSPTMKLDLDNILSALLVFAQKNAGTASEAVERMKAIKGALAEYREEEQSGSRTVWDKVLFKNAKKVIEEIDPAIDKVNNALKDLEAFCANSSNSAYKAVGITAGTVVALGIAGIALWWVTSGKKEEPVGVCKTGQEKAVFDRLLRESVEEAVSGYEQVRDVTLDKLSGIVKKAALTQASTRNCSVYLIGNVDYDSNAVALVKEAAQAAKEAAKEAAIGIDL